MQPLLSSSMAPCRAIHGALCAWGVGLSDHVVLAEAIVVHASEERVGDESAASEAKEEERPLRYHVDIYAAEGFIFALLAYLSLG